MDIINMLVQTKRTDVSTQIQNMYNECVRYERLSRSPKFRQLDTHIMKAQFPILSSLHVDKTWTLEQWKLGVILYETLMALGLTNFFHNQQTLVEKLKSRKKQDRIMTTIAMPVIKPIEDANVNELIAGVTHNNRNVLVSNDCLYVGYEYTAGGRLNHNTILKDTALYTIHVIPDVWTHGLALGVVDGHTITLVGDNQIEIGERTITISDPEQFLQQTIQKIVDNIHDELKGV